MQTHINTSQGQIPLGDALQAFRNRQLPTNDMLALLSQLSTIDSEKAEEVARSVEGQGYPKPVMKAANRILSGRSSGSSVIKSMSEGQLSEILESLAPGQKLRLKFGPEARPIAATYLIGMDESIISIPNAVEKVTMMCVSQSQRWDGEHNKTVTVCLLKVDTRWFAGRLAKELESVEIL